MKKRLLQIKNVLLLPMLFLLFMAMSMSGMAQNVTVTTNQDDYWPGEWVIITGTGWTSDAIVQLTLDKTLGGVQTPTYQLWEVQPNAAGEIFKKWFVLDVELGASFKLTALGLTTGWNAVTYFTDGNTPNINGINPGTGTIGQSVIITLNKDASTIISVKFGEVSASYNFPITNNSTLSAVVPTGTGTVNIIVSGTLSGATWTDTKNNGFTYSTCTPPTISSSPTSLPDICIGSLQNFSVTATGTAPLSYQWYKGTPSTGILISGATSSTYTVSSVAVGNAGSYYAVVSNSCGTATSTAANLTIETTPPVVAINGGSTVSCISAAAPPIVPSATDACNGTIAGVLTSTIDTPNPINCNGTRVYTYSYTDGAGNIAYWTYTYTIEREDFSIPATTDHSTVACAASATAAAVTLPVVTSDCGETLLPSAPVTNANGTDTYAGCEGTISYTWGYKDCEGNTHSWTYTYTIEREDFSIPATTDHSTVACAASATAAAVTLPVVTSDCGETLLPSAPVTNANGTDTYAGCEGTISYTWGYKDCEGNTHSWTYTYTIEREDFSIPATTDHSTVACAASATAAAVTLPVVTSDCGETLLPSAPVTNANGTDTYAGCEGTISYTWGYKDCEGNTHSWTYTYTIEREDFSIPATTDHSTVACAASATAAAVTLPVVTSDCGETLLPSAPVTNANGTDTYAGCEGTISYTWGYKDCEGNTHSWTYTYTIEREDFSIPATTDHSTVACAASATAAAVTLPVVTSDCGETLLPSAPVTNANGTDTYAGCEGTISYTWGYKDCEGNTHSWTYTYTIEREDFSIPATTDHSTVACAASATAAAVTLPVVTSDCGETLLPSAPVTNANGTDTYAGCEGTISYTWGYKDCEGNTHSWTYTYTIEREDFSIPATTDHSTVACAASATAAAVTLPVVTSDCGETLLPSAPVTNANGTDTYAGCEGTISYTWGYKDCEGNTHSWTYTYTIEREDFSIPATTDHSTVACAASATAAAVTLPVVTSDCGETLLPSAPVTNANGTDTYAGCEGTISYTWGYKDCEGNTHSWTYTYTIEREDFSIPATTDHSTVACAASATAAAVTLPVVTSDCGETLLPSAPVTNANGTDTYAGCEGTISYTWGYKDCEGNTHSWTYTYTIEREDFSIPATTDHSTVACAASATAAAVTLPVVTSDCGETLLPSAPVTNANGTDTYAGCEGTISYTWGYKDCEGNTHSWTYTYTIEREDFSIPATTDHSTVACAASATAAAVTLPVVTSDCGETLLPSAPVTNANGTDTYAGCEGTISYTWGYKDCEGNTHSRTYTYTIEREDFSIPATTDHSTVACAASATAAAVTLPVVTSDCGETLLTSAPVTNANGTDTYAGCEGTISYTWGYKDCEGNTHSWTYTYTIEREDFSIPATTDHSTVACAASATAAAVTLPVVTSDCGETLLPSAPVTNANGTDTYAGCEGTISYTWGYKDCEGNTHSWTYTYTIDDNIAPIVLTKPATVTLDLDGNASITVTDVNNGSLDNCDGTLNYKLSQSAFTCADAPGKTVTLTATDCAGNTGTKTVFITVNQRATKLVINGFIFIAEYSDPYALKATLTDATTGTKLANKTVKFQIGTQWVEATTDINGTATSTITLNQAPGSYTLTATYVGVCPFISTSATKTFAILPERACATYTGVMNASTGSINSTKATLLLSATVVADADGNTGDIRNALISFLANGVLIKQLPVGLVNQGDLAVGSASTEYTYELGTQQGATVTIAVLISGYYRNKLSSECFDITEVTISKPGTDFITGGGYLLLQSGKHAGTIKADDNSKNNFGFNVKYNKKGTNLQGNINTIVRKTQLDYNAELDVYENVVHKIQIKGTALTSLAISSGINAEFTGKAVAQDVTDPNNVVSLGGNLVMKVLMTDNGEPGTNDLLSMTVFDKDGGVLFSSRWENNQPTKQLIASGNLQVNPSGLKSAEITPEIAPLIVEPTLRAYPNPFTERLNIEFSSATDTQAKLEIYSITGAKLTTLFDAPVNGGELYKVEYVPSLGSSQMVFYHLTMDGKTQVGKVIYNERR